VASRDGARARNIANIFHLPKAYESYESMLADPEIEVVYIPLPNHLHVPWSIRAMEAGKHVLCEKPIALNAKEAQVLIDTRARTGCLIAEAAMVRQHPQWLRAASIATSGEIGTPVAVNVVFSYTQLNIENIRNKADTGGGALYDIGYYAIIAGRLFFGGEPTRVIACIDRDPRMRIDRLTSAILEFGNGSQHLTFVCGTQICSHQRIDVLGTRGRIEILRPFNPASDQPTQMNVVRDDKLETLILERANHYTLQGDMVSKAVRRLAPLAYPIEDAVATMRVVDALFRSEKQSGWVDAREPAP
jgi:predicted dehydrogenase